jgi:serine kinase of HPr protein (carbohydrate metabolism regulator)
LAPANLHATAVVLGTRGLLLTGPSGSGKSTLALHLLDAWRARGRFARLLSDDQVFVTVANGRLIASAPDSIAGLVEVHGLGPRPVDHVGRAVIDSVCRLAPAPQVPRLQDAVVEPVQGIALPSIDVPERNALTAGLAIAAWIDRPLLA